MLLTTDHPAESGQFDTHVSHPDPDVRLMLAVREGSAEAFEELVVRYQRRLISVLELLVGDRDLADDLAQDVFLRVYRARETYEPQARFSTWFFSIVNNLASNARRDRARRSTIQLPSGGGDDSEALTMGNLVADASGMMPARRAEKAEAAGMVREALNQLSDRQRMVLILAKFENMGYDEIAEALDISRDAVKSLAARARENMRRVLEPYIHDGGPAANSLEAPQPPNSDDA
jgi:RNA polymerase sigma-70 factor (ECF subfamily)